MSNKIDIQAKRIEKADLVKIENFNRDFLLSELKISLNNSKNENCLLKMKLLDAELKSFKKENDVLLKWKDDLIAESKANMDSIKKKCGHVSKTDFCFDPKTGLIR